MNYKEYNWSSHPSYSTGYILNQLIKMLNGKNKTILDVGCGNGTIAKRLIGEGYDVYGIDASKSGIEIAQRTCPDRFFLHDIYSREIPSQLINKNFDTIICIEVIEHLYNPYKLIDLCRDVLKKDGELIISTVYHGYLKNLLLAIFNRFDFHFSPHWTGGHIKFWSRKTLTKFLEKNNFEIIDFKGCGRYFFLWKSMLIKARKIK